MSQSTETRPDGPLRKTPELERLLGRLRNRLRGKVWLHGLGTLLGVVGIWLVFAFFADWALHVPKSVRWMHLGVLVALPLVFGWRELVRHLSNIPDRAGLAVLAERHRPDSEELLVTAVQLQQDERPAGDPALVERVFESADKRARELSLDGVLEESRPRRRFALGASLAAVVVAVSLAEPTYSTIFFQRLFGREVLWPQLTELTVSIPNLSEKAQIEKREDLIVVRVARGTDVPVLVRAEGRFPRDVTVHFEAGHKAVLGSSGEGIFRTLLRSCQEDLTFHVTGGDDRDGLPRIQVLVLDPPDISGLAVRVEPPAYTGRPTRVEYDSDVEVTAGSRLTVSVLPDPPESTGRVLLLPADRELDLVPTPFPRRAGVPGAEATADPRGLGFSIEANDSLRYRFEIEDDSGLSNPDPGLFAVHVVPDREPELEVLAPGRNEIDTVPGGTLSLRVKATDDFGVAAMAWSVRGTAEDEPRLASLETAPLGPLGGLADARGRSVLAGERLEVQGFAREAPATLEELAGEQFLLDVRAVDNRPGALGDDGRPLAWAQDEGRDGVGKSAVVRVRVLTEDEFLRRLQDRLARLRVEVGDLEELQRQKSQRTRELIAGLESDDPGPASSGGELAAALSGQRRVQGDAEAVTRELAAVLESVLYARIDEKAGGMLERLDARLGATATRSFQPEIWRELTAEWRGAQGSAPGLADQLVVLLALALDVSGGNVAQATGALDLATRAVDLAGVHGHLVTADRHQTAALTDIEELLGLLGEWDNFQSILTLTRDILNRQKSLRDRTREQARDK